MPWSIKDTLDGLVADGHLVCADASDFLHGCVRIASERGGWSRPWRFSAEQVRTIGSCQAWHPGLFRQMARTTAGVTLEFETDSSEIFLEVLLDGEPSGSSAVLDAVRRGEDLPLDGFSADVDGRHLACRMPAERESIVTFVLDDEDAAPEPGVVMLPGVMGPRRMRIWLPALRGCAVRRIWGNGTSIDPVAQKSQLLVIGDSIAQGFVTEDPALSWPSVLADQLGLDLVNQGLGGQVFQPGSLLGIAAHVHPEVIVVALGENYRYEPCTMRPTARDIRNHLVEVARLWPEVPTYVMTPLWHDEEAYPSHPMSCWLRVPSMIAANAAAHDEMELVDGQRLMDHEPRLLADGYEHPNAEGAAQIARRLFLYIRPPEGLADDAVLRARALRLLKAAHRRVFPLMEALRRGIGQVLAAEKGCVILDLGNGQMLAWTPDATRSMDLLSQCGNLTALGLFNSEILGDAAVTLGLPVVVRSHVCSYRRKTLLELDPEKDVRELNETYADVIRAHYSHVEWLPEEHLRSALERGDFLGGFEVGKLVGFVGENLEGSFGLLEVFEGHRRKGWGRALVSAKINQVLNRGQVPWCEIFPDNTASLELHTSLGMFIGPADGLVFLMSEG